MSLAHHADLVDLDGLAAAYVDAAEHERPALEERMVVAAHGMVAGIAHRFVHRGEATDDLHQVGHMALLGALRRYDPEAGSSFRAYAATTVAGAIRNHFRDNTWAVKVARPDQDLAAAYWSLCERSGGHDMPIPDAAREIGVDPDVLARALTASTAWRADSMNAPADDGPVVDVLDPHADPERIATAGVMTDELLRPLDDTERSLVWARVVEGRPQADTAKELGLTPMQASRRFHVAMGKLRERAEALGLEGFLGG